MQTEYRIVRGTDELAAERQRIQSEWTVAEHRRRRAWADAKQSELLLELADTLGIPKPAQTETAVRKPNKSIRLAQAPVTRERGALAVC